MGFRVSPLSKRLRGLDRGRFCFVAGVAYFKRRRIVSLPFKKHCALVLGDRPDAGRTPTAELSILVWLKPKVGAVLEIRNDLFTTMRG